MKKVNYIKPLTSIVVVNFQNHIMAGSNGVDETGNVSLNPNSMEGGNGDDANSRGGFWDDDY